jgi:hypothetical protein
VHTGVAIFDKYLGDALYAAMVYTILQFFCSNALIAIYAMATMTVIELFQLTMIPARMLASGHAVVRLGARLLGTEFSFRDLLAYAIGIACMYVIDASGRRARYSRERT